MATAKSFFVCQAAIQHSDVIKLLARPEEPGQLEAVVEGQTVKWQHKRPLGRTQARIVFRGPATAAFGYKGTIFSINTAYLGTELAHPLVDIPNIKLIDGFQPAKYNTIVPLLLSQPAARGREFHMTKAYHTNVDGLMTRFQLERVTAMQETIATSENLRAALQEEHPGFAGVFYLVSVYGFVREGAPTRPGQVIRIVPDVFDLHFVATPQTPLDVDVLLGSSPKIPVMVEKKPYPAAGTVGAAALYNAAMNTPPVLVKHQELVANLMPAMELSGIIGAQPYSPLVLDKLMRVGTEITRTFIGAQGPCVDVLQIAAASVQLAFPSLACSGTGIDVGQQLALYLLAFQELNARVDERMSGLQEMIDRLTQELRTGYGGRAADGPKNPDEQRGAADVTNDAFYDENGEDGIPLVSPPSALPPAVAVTDLSAQLRSADRQQLFGRLVCRRAAKATGKTFYLEQMALAAASEPGQFSVLWQDAAETSSKHILEWLNKQCIVHSEGLRPEQHTLIVVDHCSIKLLSALVAILAPFYGRIGLTVVCGTSCDDTTLNMWGTHLVRDTTPSARHLPAGPADAETTPTVFPLAGPLPLWTTQPNQAHIAALLAAAAQHSRPTTSELNCWAAIDVALGQFFQQEFLPWKQHASKMLLFEENELIFTGQLELLFPIRAVRDSLVAGLRSCLALHQRNFGVEPVTCQLQPAEQACYTMHSWMRNYLLAHRVDVSTVASEFYLSVKFQMPTIPIPRQVQRYMATRSLNLNRIVAE
eukprot:TRINITY_DN2912_c0_g1_i1.p1 TRINITY_DN2912_c0_g1~~TRINITY_DN2912_c0_g1_i1.p1  ORF type:complete len:762 (-),score=132.23 TRINITY_DN2912_c0_g1_i1:1102-3387(-)